MNCPYDMEGIWFVIKLIFLGILEIFGLSGFPVA